jgi:sphingomyelin phosphodiesterase
MDLYIVLSVATLAFSGVLAQEQKQDISNIKIEGTLNHNLDDPKYLEFWKEGVDHVIGQIINPPKEDDPGGSAVVPWLLWGLGDVIAPLFKQNTSTANCEAIKYAMNKIQTIMYLPGSFSLVGSLGKWGCKKFSSMDPDICDGYIDKYGPEYMDVFWNMSLDKNDNAQLLAFALTRKCPHPSLPETKISLPAPKHFTYPKASNRTMRVLHLSDLHYDPDYKVGAEAECNRPVCCHKDSQRGNSIKKPASKWGEYKCDVPPATLDHMLAHIQKIHKENPIDMVIFGGDVPPHNAWQETWEHSKYIETQSFNHMKKYLNAPNTKIYPVVGNHEGVTSNLYPFDNTPKAKNFPLYKFLADEWKEWIPSDAYAQLAKSGWYSVNHSDKLKVITLNNNLCYAYNVWLLQNSLNEDPNGMFKWLISELNSAESKGQKVFISSHVPPNGADCLQKWSQTYSKIVKAYAHVITAQFYGHTHWDEFEIFYSDSKQKTAKNAIGNSFLVPSVTTFTDINPGFRIYEVDAESFYVKDYIQYYADLNESRNWKNGPEWKELYRPKTAYPVPRAKGDYINAPFWHEVTEFIETENGFKIYNNLMYKNSRREPDIPPQERKDMICNLRASNSKEICRFVLEI